MVDLELRTVRFGIIVSDTETVYGKFVLSGRAKSLGYTSMHDTSAVITLPSDMAARYKQAEQAVDHNEFVDCIHFAHQLHGLAASTPPDGRPRSFNPANWRFNATDLEQLQQLPPGTGVVYGPQLKQGFRPEHWAVTCGNSQVIQVLGGTPIAITPVETPFAIYGVGTAALARPSSLAHLWANGGA
jgi:hypothetical protein